MCCINLGRIDTVSASSATRSCGNAHMQGVESNVVDVQVDTVEEIQRTTTLSNRYAVSSGCLRRRLLRFAGAFVTSFWCIDGRLLLAPSALTWMRVRLLHRLRVVAPCLHFVCSTLVAVPHLTGLARACKARSAIQVVRQCCRPY